MSVKGLLVIIVLSFWVVLPYDTEAESTSRVYTYQERVGDKIIPFYWKTEHQDDHVNILVYEEEKSFVNICRLDGATKQWRFTYKNRHEISVLREGNTLRISGMKEGKSLDQDYEIDDRPWFQPLSYSLREFLDSDKTQISFWTIRIDSLKPVALVAQKIGDEIVTVQGKAVIAQKVELRADGFYSHFWHADYWFRKKDNIFLIYRGVHGLPGTDETVVTLIGASE